MSRLGLKSVVYHGEMCLGELDVIPVTGQNFQFPNNEIRIHHISQQSERCPPLSILQTISSFSVRCKLESSSPVEQPHLKHLHGFCFFELKTAVVLVGEEEIHLVAMPSKEKKFPCFWCYSVPVGLYSASLGMLNLRCLSIVFDLDETLIVANTMKLFDDRIEALRSWIAREVDGVRIAGMSAEMRRYIDDRWLLKQYIDNDCVVDNGKVYKVQLEEVPPLSDNHEKIVRPIIRLPEKNIVLTRINPEIRDTSVLVRLRPAWEDLRSYLTAKGRKRFEVYVCTMAERDYALEMWRLLDPEAHLIGPKQLLDRVVCVKTGSRKSLLNVFQHGACHPKMAMVIDDRLKVWEDKDQPRVHVVPAFTPYYAPQAETTSPVAVLCVARNVACNVRGCFFKEFDEILIQRIAGINYEDEVKNLPPAPDVSNYLMTEDAVPATNGNVSASAGDGMTPSEIGRRIYQSDDKFGTNSVAHIVKVHAELRSDNSQAPVAILSNVTGAVSLRPIMPSQKPGLLGPPVRRDSFSDRDYESKRGLLGTNPGLDIRSQNSAEPLLISRVPVQIPASSVQTQGGWLVDDDGNKEHPSSRPSGFAQQADALKSEKLVQKSPFSPAASGSAEPPLISRVPVQIPASSIQAQGGWLVDDDCNKEHPSSRPSGFAQQADALKSEKLVQQSSFSPAASGSAPTGLLSQKSDVKREEVRADLQKLNLPSPSQLSEAGVPENNASSFIRESQTESVKVNLLPSPFSMPVLLDIGRKCGSKIEFRSVVSTSNDLQFSVEVLFTGEKIGFGMGRTRKDAQQQAADNALHSLAEKYLAYATPRSGAVDRDIDRVSVGGENGFIVDMVGPVLDEPLREDRMPKESTSEAADVEPGSTNNTASHQVQKRAVSPRSLPPVPNKRPKEELPRTLLYSRKQKVANSDKP